MTIAPVREAHVACFQDKLQWLCSSSKEHSASKQKAEKVRHVHHTCFTKTIVCTDLQKYLYKHLKSGLVQLDQLQIFAFIVNESLLIQYHKYNLLLQALP